MTKQVQLNCMVCGRAFIGPEPEICCSGRDCGCMGMPIDPIICSEWCYHHMPHNIDDMANKAWGKSHLEMLHKHSFILGFKAAMQQEVLTRSQEQQNKQA